MVGQFHHLEVPNAYSNRVRVMTQSGELLESTDSLRIQYNIGSEPGSYYGDTHLNNQLDGGHLFYVNQEIFDVPERMEALERTLDDFVCKTGVNFRLAAESTALGNDLGDGQNTITFDSSDAPLGMGTAGICWTNWWSCILGDITFYVVGEMDVVINSAIDWDFSTGPVGEGQAKFAYVLMHELGHAMRLGHVNEWGESMYPTVTNWPSNEWCERDTISTNERLGVSLAVERASTFTFDACGISNMVPLEVDCEPVVDVFEAPALELGLKAPFPNPFIDQVWIPGLADRRIPRIRSHSEFHWTSRRSFDHSGHGSTLECSGPARRHLFHSINSVRILIKSNGRHPHHQIDDALRKIT